MTRFTLWSLDTARLVHFITTKLEDDRIGYEECHFDVDDDGNVTVHVEGKGSITL